uniref:Ig-like domain-containing protein n=1 Tax=Gasterosteus aculeatus aculeatus TaxID=481459 RepID=G3PFR5_GASAC
MTNSCVVIPCTFMYPSGIRPYRGTHGIWYFGQPYPQLFPPVVFKTRTDVVHESYKGRTKLLGDLLQRNCTLLINNIGAEHSGRYYFRADLGGANMYTYPDFSELKVLDQPNIDVPEEIVSDESLELTCYAPDNCPDMTPEIQWMYTDYLPDPEFSSDYLEESNTAVLSNTLSFTPRPMHNGQLLGCRVFYPNTTLVYERLISLDIKYAPRSVWVNVSSEVMEGSSVTLHCEVDSNPPSRISWMFAEQELLWDTAPNVSLSLDDVTPAQEGIYTCIGDNGYGVMNTSLYLAVKYPPREPVVNDSMTVQEGSSLTLHCSTQGSPAPTLTWLKDGELVGTITADELSVLQVVEITPQGDGQYRCLAENEHGRASSSFNITVEYAPVLLEESKCTVVREGVQCVCMAMGNPEPTIEFYLPDLNVTINETDGRYNFYTHTDGHTSTGMIKLREKGERVDNGGPAVNVHCSIFNTYGRESVLLELQQERRRRGLSTCGLYGRTGEARAELRCSGVHRGSAQGRGLGEGGRRRQLLGNQSQMNSNPSLIPRLREIQWQPQQMFCLLYPPHPLTHTVNPPPTSTGFIPSDWSHIMYHSDATTPLTCCAPPPLAPPHTPSFSGKLV